MAEAYGSLKSLKSESVVRRVINCLTNTEKMTAAEKRCFPGTACEDVCRYYRELIHTTGEDLLALCGTPEDIEADGAVCVIAGKNQVEERGDMPAIRRPLFQQECHDQSPASLS